MKEEILLKGVEISREISRLNQALESLQEGKLTYIKFGISRSDGLRLDSGDKNTQVLHSLGLCKTLMSATIKEEIEKLEQELKAL